MQIKDFYGEGLMDQVCIPMRNFSPWLPINMEITNEHRSNPTQRWRVFLTVQLETPLKGKDEELVAVVVNSTTFDPPILSNVQNFSFVLTDSEFELGSFPWATI